MILRHGVRIIAASSLRAPSRPSQLTPRLATRLSSTAGPSASQPPAPPDLLESYRTLVSSGRLTWDDEQVRTVMKLRRLAAELASYEPPLDLVSKLGARPPLAASERAWYDRLPGLRERVLPDDGERGKALVRVLTGEEEIANLTTPRGILLTGPPGSGKSLLLALFFDTLPTPHKQRHHYHAFTLWLYQRVFDELRRRKDGTLPGQAEANKVLAGRRGWRAVFSGGRWESPNGDKAASEVGYDDPRDTIPFVIAKEMILSYHILYFDELQLVDASSAALLRDVLSWYWRLGGVVLACSNRVPDELYHHGVQRERMAGFLDSLKGRCEVVEVDGGRDWRRRDDGTSASAAPRWLELGDARFDAAWDALPGPAAPADVVVYGRRVHVPATKGTACRFAFADLCEAALGPADYISLASTFETFFIDDVKIMLLRNKNEARRLINVIDALYEARCKIVIRAAARPEHLFFPDALDPSIDPEHHNPLEAEALSESLGAQARANVSTYNPRTRAQRERDDRADRGSSFAVSAIFTGEDERFAYKRAVSRLAEMSSSASYAAEAWIPLAPAERGWEGGEAPHARETPRGIVHRDAGSGFRGEDAMAAEAGAAHVHRLRRDRHQVVEEPELPPPDAPTSGPRDGAPRIAEVHAWGVEEGWGARAGRWGRGAKAHEEGGEKSEERK
ncbi:hypothetical protein VHUM_01059 [Vanrija humicola]|uniref:AAA+ ATPase domain-containing protein n=1 Tax=Vanrija humicola TaxID=5417 RepID=A0A7D8Z6E2_VANHU|nr:hypothetical protein VHUM_01059 [Vanrija humicola]